MEKSNPRIPVIIPYYKAPEKIAKCKEHLSKQTISVETFIRDNDNDNILFTKAVNEGLKKFIYTNEFVLVLSQDVYLDPNCIKRLYDYMLTNPRCGIACPIQVIGDRVTWAGSLDAFPTGVHSCGPLSDYKEPFETYWANGACMLFRSEMVKEIGLMDDNMKFICSDSDYSFTARSRGWKIFVVNNAIAEHELDGSARNDNPWLNLIKANDVLYFMDKWLTGDLYKRLSFEGMTLTNGEINTEKYRLQNFKKRLMASKPGLSTLSLCPS